MIFPPPVEVGRIVTLPVLVAALAEETGERLAVAPELENEAIYLRRFALNGRTLPLEDGSHDSAAGPPQSPAH